MLSAAPRKAYAAEHVIHISVDGLRPSHLQAIVDGGLLPNFKRLQDEGAWTNNARTDYTHTITLPNHTSMLTGRPVSQPAGMPNDVHHGYTNNDDPAPGETLHNAGNPNAGYIASVFDVVHDAGLTTALFAAKSKFSLFDNSYDADSGAPHANGRDKIDDFYAAQNGSLPYSATMQNRFLADMAANRFNYAFVHCADTDVAGHDSGWGSLAYIQALRAVDVYLGQVFALVEGDANLAGKTSIVLTTDHGGSGTGHGTATAPENYTIPVYAWGVGVGPGDLYEFNSLVRQNPGTSRPDYNAAGQPIRNGDTGNLALSLLGLPAIPGSLINRAQDLRVAAQGDYNFDGVIDAADYTVWRNSAGTSGIGLAADGNGDRAVDDLDYEYWKSRFGASAGQGAGLSRPVPEPA
ncbi:MAG: alkaline phosphatase family protein, partial [Pirellulales bacterium]